MKFINPIATVGDKKFANCARIRPVKIDRFAPIILFVTLREIMIGENADVISVWTEVVVNDI